MADNGEHVNIDDPQPPPFEERRRRPFREDRQDNKTLMWVAAIIGTILAIIVIYAVWPKNEKVTDPVAKLERAVVGEEITEELKKLREGQSVLFENQKKLDEKINNIPTTPQPAQVNCEDVKKCLTTPPKTPTHPQTHPTPTPKPPPPPPTATNDNKLEIVVHCSGGCSDIPPPPPPPQVENPLPPPPPQPTEQKVRKVTILTPTYYIKTDSYPDKKWRKNK